ncbi:MAG: CaiB/BaiF CoA transferase family protein [Alphaproteobacteria bacterium]
MPKASQPTGPLAGVKVVEFSVFMAGPTCGLMLADMGADVIKVEKTPDGEDTRRLTPPAVNGEPASFMIMNRNKRGFAVDLKSEGGKRAIRKLIQGADILIENFRPGTLEKLGLGYEELRKDNPGLVYGKASGYGLTGPLSDRGGVDLIAQAFSGVMSVTGEAPGRPPVKVGPPLSDTTAGMLLAMGVTAAYANRLKTGEGQLVETSLIEAAMSHTYWQSAIYFATGESAGPMGSAHPLTSPYQAYRCADGFAVLCASNQKHWEALIRAIGAPEALIADPRFVDNGSRRRNNEALTEALEAVLTKHPRRHWIEKLEAVGVPVGPVHSIGEALDHPHTVAREMVVEVDHPRAGRMKTLGCPVKFSRTRAQVRKAAPLYGEDTRDILREIGFGEAEIAELEREGAVGVTEGAQQRPVK